MKKLNRVASLFAVAAVVSSGAFAQTVDNWRATDGTVWKNGTNELCWRDTNWTPATAAKECDGAIKPAPMVAPAAGTAASRCTRTRARSRSCPRPAGAGQREGDLCC